MFSVTFVFFTLTKGVSY